MRPIDEGVFREVDRGTRAKIGTVCPVGDEEALAGKIEGGRPDRGDSKVRGQIAEGADPPRGGNGCGVQRLWVGLSPESDTMFTPQGINAEIDFPKDERARQAS